MKVVSMQVLDVEEHRMAVGGAQYALRGSAIGVTVLPPALAVAEDPAGVRNSAMDLPGSLLLGVPRDDHEPHLRAKSPSGEGRSFS